MKVKPSYCCRTEVETPDLILVHEPGLETRLAVEDPDFWGFDPSLKDDPRPFEKWLEDAQGEHQEMVSVLRGEGVEVLQVRDLLEGKVTEIRKYLAQQFTRIKPRLAEFSPETRGAIREAYRAMRESPVEGVLMGLEFGETFRGLPYAEKLEVYKKLGTLMPQTSLYYTQDSVISSPAGLIKARMSMFIRRQEPDVVEIALGRENYIHRLRNGTEGGDVTICSFFHGGDVLYSGGRMLLGISALSGVNVEAESEVIARKAGVTNLVKFYTPDYFDRSQRYATENVMHLDTLLMPVGEGVLLANIRMLEQTAVRDGGKPLVNAYEWAKKNFKTIVAVPDDEQQGTFGWGSNVLPLGKGKILSSSHLKGTNHNLRQAGYTVIAINSSTLTSGFGSHHCMTAYLR